MTLRRFESVSITCSMEPELSPEQAKLFSQRLRTRDVLSELGVKEVALIDPAEDGHIELKMPDKSEIVVHPMHDFRVRASDVSPDEVSGLEGHILGIVKQIEEVKKTVSVRIRATAHGFLERENGQMVAKWFLPFEKLCKTSFQGRMRPRAMLLEVSSQVSVAVDPPAHVDVYITTKLPASRMSKTFLSRLLDEGLKGLSELVEAGKS
jgi:hypothetical protein